MKEGVKDLLSGFGDLNVDNMTDAGLQKILEETQTKLDMPELYEKYREIEQLEKHLESLRQKDSEIEERFNKAYERNASDEEIASLTRESDDIYAQIKEAEET